MGEHHLIISNFFLLLISEATVTKVETGDDD